MMLNYKNLKDIVTSYYKPARSKKLDKPLSDTIYVFDIETTSLFDIDGEYKTFDYTRPAEYYQGRDKVAVPYIWQFGVEDDVYFGREFRDFEKVLQKISSPDCYKVIWCHNLSFEQVFLMNIFDGKYTIENMVARSIKAPIEFTVKELNIIFRCSYMLTNLSLDAAAKEYTSIRKRSGAEFNYNVARSPKTKLSKLEMEYCEFDIRTVTEIIRYFKDRYDGHLYNIPLTSTSIVRTELKKRLDIWYIKHQQKLVPNRYIYLMLWQAFAGGFTHANIIHSGKPLINRHTGEFLPAEGEDEASEYPTKMATEMFPCSGFIRCKYDHYLDKHKRAAYAFLFKIEFRGVKSNYYTHFMQASKCLEYPQWCKKDSKARVIIDNGRIVSCDKCTLVLTDVDFEILKKNYSFKKIIVLECYKAKKDYLDVRIIKFIQELYKNKTTLKGVEGKEVIYKRDKSMLNSLYGMSVTNPLKQSAKFENGIWSTAEFSRDFINEKLADMKKSYSTLMYYAVGVWVTAYARRDLAKIIFSSKDMDRDVIYCDTDSVKFLNREKHQDIFLSYNNEMIEKYRNVAERYPDDIDIADFMPADRKGVLHPLGFFEFDGLYTEFVTLGAKKYCYREDGELHITVAGVSKKGVAALGDDIRKFKKGFIWDYHNSGKSTHFYRERHLVTYKVKDKDTDQIIKKSKVEDDTQKPFKFKDIDGNVYKCRYKWALVLMPTTYELGVTAEYESVIKDILRRERKRNE